MFQVHINRIQTKINLLNTQLDKLKISESNNPDISLNTSLKLQQIENMLDLWINN